MALSPPQPKTPLSQPPHDRQLGLFDQQSVTFGEVNRSCDAVNRVLSGPKPIVKATRFEPRPGCALHCDCYRCLNP